MMESLAHRGLDGGDIWYQNANHIALGHQMLWTTPESLHEKLPLTDITGNFTITADARIDNRDELLNALGLKNNSQVIISDSTLILEAYKKWGERCPEYLLGDFAFAIWDEVQQVLFCARDHFGVNPFYYYLLTGKIFVLASEIGGVLGVADVPHRLNETELAVYLKILEPRPEITFYQDIFALQAAHWLRVSPQGLTIRQYWSLDPERELRLNSDEEYAEQLRELFTEAVRCRIRSAFPIGSTLSGGLDSSSNTCMARHLLGQDSSSRLHTFSMFYNKIPQCDERQYMNAVVEQGGLTPHFIAVDDYSLMTDIERIPWYAEHPFYPPNWLCPWEPYRTAHQNGVRVLLDGSCGDSTIYFGLGYLTELARAGKWQVFAAEAQGLSQHYRVTPFGLLESYGLPYLTELAQQKQMPQMLSALSQIVQHFDGSPWQLIRNYGIRPLASEPVRQRWRNFRGRGASTHPPVEISVNPDFAKRLGMTKPCLAFQPQPSVLPKTAREDHYSEVMSWTKKRFSLGINNASAAFGIETRYPFVDVRLVEFCLSLPPEQKLHQGWNRIVMRRAMAGILPDALRWRGGKTTYTKSLIGGLYSHEQQQLADFLSRYSSILDPYLEMGTIKFLYEQFLSQPTQQNAMTLWKICNLAFWLNRTGLSQ
jgi:asparagine synthase (glutamine-hydrolysing)